MNTSPIRCVLQLILLASVVAYLAGCAKPDADRPGAPAALSTRPATPPVPPFYAERMPDADRAINEAIARNELPGAVLLVGRGDQTGGNVLYRKAYGNRSVQPTTQPMTTDTVFDLASLSKPVGCATSVMVLIERGLVKPDEPVATYLPEFAQQGKGEITVAQLLLHQSGLIADNAMADYHGGAAMAWDKICKLKPQTAIGTTFKYSDVGYIVLGKLVEKVSGRPLDQFAREEVFQPTGMTMTSYNPPAEWKPRTAPTQQRKDHWMVGEVHDPRAFAMGGVAGHAGVFSTADDLSRYCRMLLNKGKIDGEQVLQPATVATMTEPRSLPDGTNRRTFGFDSDTAYSSPRGERFNRGSTFGHTGFTGTCFWIDPVNDCYYILLTNAVHPDGKGKTVALRKRVATIAAEALLGPSPATQPTAAAEPAAVPAAAQMKAEPVATGLDRLVAQAFKPLIGKRVAVVTNQTGIDRQGRRLVDLLVAAKGVKVAKLFSPEHGLYGVLDEKVADAVDPTTGLHVYSLYGKTRKPTPQMMADVDLLLFDIQDAGARYYTYVSTMGLCMEACAEAKVPMMVLDRPNPVRGDAVEGPVADEGSLNFVSYARLPIRHGMTVGELAKLLNAERKIGCDLSIVEMTGWRRSMWFDETGLTWINPSPNLRNPTQALLYLGVGQIEMANISVGRGTDQPFELIGAPWMDGQKLAAALNDAKLPGLRFTPITFTPKSSKHEGKVCQGIYIGVTDRAVVEPVQLGTALAWHLRSLFGDTFEIDKVNTLLKSQATMQAIKAAPSIGEIPAVWQKELEAFRGVREKYLIYK